MKGTIMNKKNIFARAFDRYVDWTMQEDVSLITMIKNRKK